MNTTKETNNATLIERLFAVGAHFGFSKSRRHPSVRPYLFGTKQGSDIFDLEKTGELLTDASAFLADIGTKGKRVLFVGTKPEISDLAHKAAQTVEMPYVTNRWIGGILTNFPEIKKRVDRLASLKEQKLSGELDRKYTKKERLLIDREVDKLEFNFSGIAAMDVMPAALIVVDPRHEAIAVAEARQMKIPTVALMSSDCDLGLVTKPIVMNDANRESVSFVLNELAKAYASGRAQYVPKVEAPRTNKQRPVGETA